VTDLNSLSTIFLRGFKIHCFVLVLGANNVVCLDNGDGFVVRLMFLAKQSIVTTIDFAWKSCRSFCRGDLRVDVESSIV
jgi:hypothetical protein